MYFFYDIETGGNTTSYSLLTLYGVILDKNFNQVDSISLKIKPDDGIYRIEPEALEINKIDLIAHDKVAITESQAKVQINRFIEDYNTLFDGKLTFGGWNTYWDNQFVQKYLCPNLNDLISRHLFDVASIAVLLKSMGKIPSSLKISLVNLAKHYNVNLENAHDAEFDLKATIAVLKCMQKEINSGNH